MLKEDGVNDAYYWIGVGVVFTIAPATIIFALAFAYARLIHRRFGLIFFQRRPRRLSIASWHQSKIVQLSGAPRDDDWLADDFPVNERPFLLTCRVGGRRYFVMAGYLGPHRLAPIKGIHP